MANLALSSQQLLACGLTQGPAEALARQINDCLHRLEPAPCWSALTRTILRPELPFAVHRLVFATVFAGWDSGQGPPPAWMPTEELIRSSNLAWLMDQVGVASYPALHAWTANHREAFWALVLQRLQIRLQRPFTKLLELSRGPESPRWLADARLNIVDSLFAAPPGSPAIVYQPEGGSLSRLTCAQLESLVQRVACSLGRAGFQPGDALAIVMPMTVEAVAIYLGIVKAGCAVVSIADSFSPPEMATRLRLGRARAVFTQDLQLRGGKQLPLYATVSAAEPPPIIVVPAHQTLSVSLRPADQTWADFLAVQPPSDPPLARGGTGGWAAAVPGDPADPINIMFSSGTTGEPKAISWVQTAAIKAAMDAHFHHNVQPGDLLVWPTSLGWMMGPWLIFASLLNRATMGLYYGTPTGAEFCRFVQDSQATLLGVVPSLVKSWRGRGCLDRLDWTGLKVLSSTGECSNAEDMLFLMSRAGYRPIIEYCGGTEIGGAYITGTVVQPASPATFTTPALGLDFVILDEAGQPADNGELFLLPPSIGLSTALLNQDHHDVYFADTPPGPNGEMLRRHGDQVERLPGGFYRAHGRVDDTMNLGGIKVSSAEIERTLLAVADLQDVAAIAVPPPGGGPSLLVIFLVLAPGVAAQKQGLLPLLQQTIKRDLNPLFKIHDLVVVDALPRTASNKVMRRVLRQQYLAG